MKKAVRHILKFLAGVILLFALLGCLLVAFVSWVWGGVRFSPEAAMEAVGQGAGRQEFIQADGYRFYYTTVADLCGSTAGSDDRICEVTPVAQNGIGMWYAIPKPPSRPVYAEGVDAAVGHLISVTVDGAYHYFFLLYFEGNGDTELPENLPKTYDRLLVEGEELPLQKHCYFFTDVKVEAFEIDGVRFTVGK